MVEAGILLVIDNGDISGVGRWVAHEGIQIAGPSRTTVVFWRHGGAIADQLAGAVSRIALHARNGRDVVASVRLLRLIYHLQPSVVHFTDQPLLPILLCRLMRVPFTCTLHVFPRRGRGTLARRVAVAGARAVIAVSPAVAEMARSTLAAANKVVVIPAATPKPKYVRISMAGTPLAVLPTRLVRGKGVELVSSVLEVINRDGIRFRARVFGEGPLRAALELDADRLDGALEVMPAEWDLDRLYVGADAVLFTSPEETFGLTIIEGMARGLPVIGVRSGTPQDWVLGAVCSYVAHGQALKGLVNAVEAFLASPPGYADRRQLHEEFASRFTLEHSLDEHRRVLPEYQARNARRTSRRWNSSFR